MYNWNTAYLKYCDGGSFTGNRKEALNVTVSGKEVSLWFRGAANRDAMIADMASTALCQTYLWSPQR